MSSILDEISGVGPKTKIKLLNKFKSLKRAKEASKKDLIELLGNKMGEIIFEKFVK